MATNDTDYSPQTWTTGDAATPVNGPRLTHAEQGIKHHNHPALTDAEAEGPGGSGNGIFWHVTGADGAQSVHIKLGAFAAVEWVLNADGSLTTPAGFKVWTVPGVPGSGVGSDGDWALSENGHQYFKKLNNDPTPIPAWFQYDEHGAGLFSHAEGLSPTATGAVSHAEGASTVASGAYSHAEGYGSQAMLPSSHAWAAGLLPSSLVGEGIRVPLQPRQTTNATPVALRDASSQPLTLADGCWAIQGFVAARRHDVIGTVSYWRFDALIESHLNLPTPSLRLIGHTVTMIYQDVAASTWGVTLDVDGGVDLEILVTGQAAKTINWVASFEGAFIQ